MVIGFNAKANKDVKATAKSLSVDLRSYNIIYQVARVGDQRTRRPASSDHAAAAPCASRRRWFMQLLDDARKMMGEQLPRIVTTTVVGSADVLARFDVAGPNKQPVVIAGCRVKDGSLMRNATYRLLRNGKSVFEGTVAMAAAAGPATEQRRTDGTARPRPGGPRAGGEAPAGRASSLKVVKKDVDAVQKGHECGLALEVRGLACRAPPNDHWPQH